MNDKFDRTVFVLGNIHGGALADFVLPLAFQIHVTGIGIQELFTQFGCLIQNILLLVFHRRNQAGFFFLAQFLLLRRGFLARCQSKDQHEGGQKCNEF